MHCWMQFREDASIGPSVRTRTIPEFVGRYPVDGFRRILGEPHRGRAPLRRDRRRATARRLCRPTPSPSPLSDHRHPRRAAYVERKRHLPPRPFTRIRPHAAGNSKRFKRCNSEWGGRGTKKGAGVEGAEGVGCTR